MAQPTRNFTVPPPDFGPELLRPADLFRSGASPPRVGPGIRFGPVSRFSPAARLRPAARLGPELHRPASGCNIFPDRCNRFSALPPGRLSPQRSMPPRHHSAGGCNIFPDRCNRLSCPAAAWRTGAAMLHAAPRHLADRRRNAPDNPAATGSPPRRRSADERCNRFSAPPPLTGQRRERRRRQRPWRGGAPGRPRRQRCGTRRWDGGPERPADRTGRAAGPCAAPRPARGR